MIIYFIFYKIIKSEKKPYRSNSVFIKTSYMDIPMKATKFKSYYNKIFFIYLIIQNNCVFGIPFFNSKEKISVIKRNLNEISGSIPASIDQLINQLNKLPLHENIKNNFQNKLLLYGPPGNGKTKLANIIAQETNSHFMEISSSSIVNAYIGSGPQELDKIFNDALRQSFGKGQRVVIFFDEVDTFAGNNFIDNTNQYIITVKHFWLWLDKLRKNSNIFVIVATNKFKNLSPAFASRFKSIEIPNPDKYMREEVINYFIQKINSDFDPNFKLNKRTINKLVQETNQLSIRSIEEIINSLQQKSPCTLKQLINAEKNKPVEELNPNEEKKSAEKFQKYNTIYNTFLGSASLALAYLTYKLNFRNNNILNYDKI